MSTPNHEPYSTPPVPPVPPAPPQPDVAWSQPYRLRKSPVLAAFLSFFPGLGQLYLGLYERGLAVAAAFFFGIFLANRVDAAGFLVAFVWFFGVIDAYRQAQVMNMGGIDPTPKPARAGQRSLGLGIFLTVVGGILLINNFYPLDFEWIEDWWPAFVVAIGLYFVIAALKERQEKERAERMQELDEGGSSDGDVSV